MYRLFTLLAILLIVISCKKDEFIPEDPSLIYPETFPAFYSGNGIWLVDKLVIENPSNPALSSEIIDAGTLHFFSDSSLIFRHIDNTVDSFYYTINQNKSILTLFKGGILFSNCPVRWTNANKMNFLVQSTDCGVSENKTFYVTR